MVVAVTDTILGPARYDGRLIYTCYEMIRDCREGRTEGWAYFVRHYVPVVRAVLDHYCGNRPELMASVLGRLREPSLFQSLEPAPERTFVAALRQHVLPAAADGTADLDSLSEALDSLTLTEKLVVWFETMRYSDAVAGRMLRMSPQTAQQIRGRAAELMRRRLDTWSSTILSDNGRELARAAGERATKECVPDKVFFDVIDGRATWRGREELERHVKGCWYCLDHYCRLLEAVDLLRAVKPLEESEAAEYRRLLGIETPKRSFWKRSAT